MGVLASTGTGVAYEGAAGDRLMGGFNPQVLDVNDEWYHDGHPLSARGWALWRNDPYARAMSETMLGGVFGAHGLCFRSLYSRDDTDETDDAERAVRRKINGWLRRASKGTNLDAGGALTRLELERALQLSKDVAGDGFAVRLWKPGRPGARTGYCWRLLDRDRVCNPNDAANSERFFEGLELDDSGSPIAIHVVSEHPNIQRHSGKRKWTRIPMIGADGARQVLHRRSTHRPDQLRGFSRFAPVMLDLYNLKELKKAFIVAKRAHASLCFSIKTKDPQRAAAADKNGAMMAGNVGIKPLMKYYLGLDDEVQQHSGNFEGDDFDALMIAILQVCTATWGLPVEMVIRRLTRTNMAASRSALLDFYATCTREQDEHIEQVSRHIDESLIREGATRGQFPVDAGDERALEGHYERPPRMFPDPHKEALAAAEWAKLGRSLTNLFAEQGLDFEGQVRQRSQDNALADAQGVQIGEPAAAPAANETEDEPAADPEEATA